MDGGAWWAAVHGVTKSRTRLSDFPFTFQFYALEKEMATHSNVLAWRIPGTGEPGGLPSMGSHRVGHDWSDLAAAAAAVSGGHNYIASRVEEPFWFLALLETNSPSPEGVCVREAGTAVAVRLLQQPSGSPVCKGEVRTFRSDALTTCL